MDFTVFNERIFFYHKFELFFRDEVIALSINFSLPRASCCEWHTKAKTILVFICHVINQYTFTNSRWTNYNQRLVEWVLKFLWNFHLGIPFWIVFLNHYQKIGLTIFFNNKLLCCFTIMAKTQQSIFRKFCVELFFFLFPHLLLLPFRFTLIITLLSHTLWLF